MVKHYGLSHSEVQDLTFIQQSAYIGQIDILDKLFSGKGHEFKPMDNEQTIEHLRNLGYTVPSWPQ